MKIKPQNTFHPKCPSLWSRSSLVRPPLLENVWDTLARSLKAAPEPQPIRSKPSKPQASKLPNTRKKFRRFSNKIRWLSSHERSERHIETTTKQNISVTKVFW